MGILIQKQSWVVITIDQINYDVIVVGAGLAGLSCAHALADKGKRVLVLEAHRYVGGRTSSFTDDGMAVESGLHRYIGYYSALPKLLKQCGVSINDIVTWEEKVDILVKHQKKKMVLGLAPFFAPIKTARGLLENQDVLTAKDKWSLIPFFVCGFFRYLFSQTLDKVSVTQYANRHRVSEKSKRLLLEPLSSGIFFLPPENYSAYAFFGLFAPAIPKFYKMRIGAFLGGMTEVMCDPIRKKTQSLGGEFRMGQTVERVLVEQGKVVGVVTQSGEHLYAPHTVIATSLPSAKTILTPLRHCSQLRRLFLLPCMSACTIQLELDKPALEKDITTFGPGTDMVSFAEQSRTTFRGSKGRLSVILGNAKEHTAKSTEQLLSLTEKQLADLGVHIRGHVLAARKVAEEDAFYSLSPNNQRLRPTQKTGIEGLTLAGDYTKTSSFATMEGAVLSGQKAAHNVLRSNKTK